MLNLRRQDGDTIVEVLIAMAVMALVLGGSYATASRALQVGRQAQERTEALKLVEGQVEQIKYLSADPTKNIFSTTETNFCIDNSQKQNIAQFNTFPYRAECFKANLYNVGIQYEAAKHDLFTVRATWDRLGGGGQDEVIIRYRLHK